MKYQYAILSAIAFTLFYAPLTNSAPCPFDTTKTCNLFLNILTDRDASGLRYYGPTNYDHRFSGEVNVYDSTLVQPYSDNVNVPGQIKLTAVRSGNPAFKSGQIMTRVNLNQPPYNAPLPIHPFTTEDIAHGYLEARVKLPKCDVSDDGLCQAGTAPTSYTRGLWPSVWMLPTFDINWPQNGEIDIWEAYQLGRDFNVTTSALHFNGNSPSCGGGDCKFIGYPLAVPAAPSPLYNDFHTWGFEWQPDPNSHTGGVIMTGYFDNVRVWGPLPTDSLPADGPNAFSRGFHDPAGGFYVIAALAVGGGYAGPPNPHLQTATMYVQSIKAYAVGTTPPPPNKCLPPANITSSFTPDKKTITLNWQQPTGSDTILNYQINDWLNRVLWTGTTTTYTDRTLPGTNGTFTYFLYSHCPSGLSAGVQVNVVINDAPQQLCMPPANIQSSYTPDRKQITLTWQAPTNSAPVSNYQVFDWLKRIIWRGTATTFVDNTLPGTPGKFVYFLNTNCTVGSSALVEKDVVIT